MSTTPNQSMQARAAIISKQLAMTQLAEADNSIDAALSVLGAVDALATIPEALFVNYYLPYFSGTMPEDVAKNEKLIQEMVVHWIGVAGGPHLEMGVVDDAGALLFKVPALYTTDKLKALGVGGRGLLDLVAEFRQRQAQSPIAATAWWTGELAAKAQGILPDGYASPETAKFVDDPRWMEIFERYKVAPNKDAAKLTSASAADPADDLLYD